MELPPGRARDGDWLVHQAGARGPDSRRFLHMARDALGVALKDDDADVRAYARRALEYQPA